MKICVICEAFLREYLTGRQRILDAVEFDRYIFKERFYVKVVVEILPAKFTLKSDRNLSKGASDYTENVSFREEAAEKESACE